MQCVELCQHVRNPGAAGLRQDVTQLWEAFEDPRQDELGKAALREEWNLRDPHRAGGWIGTVVRESCTAVLIQHDLEILAHGPQPVVARRVKGFDVLVVRWR